MLCALMAIHGWRWMTQKINLDSFFFFFFSENACVQEDPAGVDLPHLQHDAAQLCGVVGQLAHLLLWVRGAAVGAGQTGRALHRVRGQVPREVQGPAQRRLLAESVALFLVSCLCSFIFPLRGGWLVGVWLEYPCNDECLAVYESNAEGTNFRIMFRYVLCLYIYSVCVLCCIQLVWELNLWKALRWPCAVDWAISLQ